MKIKTIDASREAGVTAAMAPNPGAARIAGAAWLMALLCMVTALLAGCQDTMNARSMRSEQVQQVQQESAPSPHHAKKSFVKAAAFRSPAPVVESAPMAAAPPPVAVVASMQTMRGVPQPEPFNTETYNRVYENRFFQTLQNPLSTFSIDVDTASYTNVRRYLAGGLLPPQDAVRAEEMINYFNYDYPAPKGDEPFSFTSRLTAAPWQPDHQLLLVGLQGKKIPLEQLPPANLVFLIDVSGSMADDNKLPLLVRSFKLLVNELRPVDRVSIVVYAGQAGVVLPPTPGSDRGRIVAALDSLTAGGSTAGGEGLKLAYAVAKQTFLKDGNNRIIMATDGDFNVGASSQGELVRMIEEKRQEGVLLSVLGFGMGNYKDATMQMLADHGNGNYAYIDTLLEAKKVLVSQLGGTLFTIAKDVKLQVEFNPAKVKAYRLIGYEKRALSREDFADDKKDAGELGSGHTVTALYEIVPADGATAPAENLTYQTTQVKDGARQSPELATIRFRYKEPTSDTSKETVTVIPAQSLPLAQAGDDIKFAAAVAEWSMLLSGSEHKGNASFPSVLELARKAKGSDERGLRAEFIRLVEMSELVTVKP